jgi:hypothetical protein
VQFFYKVIILFLLKNQTVKKHATAFNAIIQANALHVPQAVGVLDLADPRDFLEEIVSNGSVTFPTYKIKASDKIYPLIAANKLSVAYPELPSAMSLAMSDIVKWLTYMLDEESIQYVVSHFTGIKKMVNFISLTLVALSQIEYDIVNVDYSAFKHGWPQALSIASALYVGIRKQEHQIEKAYHGQVFTAWECINQRCPVYVFVCEEFPDKQWYVKLVKRTLLAGPVLRSEEIEHRLWGKSIGENFHWSAAIRAKGIASNVIEAMSDARTQSHKRAVPSDMASDVGAQSRKGARSSNTARK